jgi:hypothetical protein
MIQARNINKSIIGMEKMKITGRLKQSRRKVQREKGIAQGLVQIVAKGQNKLRKELGVSLSWHNTRLACMKACVYSPVSDHG